MDLAQIRANIEKDAVGMLYSDDIQAILEAIEDFKKKHHYLPDDVDEWYENIIELQQMEEEMKCEYEAFCWKKFLED